MTYSRASIPSIIAILLPLACAPAAPRERFADVGLPLVVTDAAAPDCGAPVPTVTATGTAPAPLPPTPSCAPGPGIDYEVGPGRPYVTIGAVPWELLQPGATVRIHWKAEAYREKIMIGALGGTAALPVKVCGVRGPNGELPVIDGNGATTRKELYGYFPYDGHQVRGVVIVGHPNNARDYKSTPANIIIEGLEIRGGAPPNSFTDASGVVRAYSNPAAGIFVERANGLVIRGCNITENNNGIFAGTGGGVAATYNLSLIGNHIWNNGSTSDYYEHNSYVEGINTLYEANWYGPVRGGKGAGIKDRGSIEAIRYNWIEGGAHIIGLVDAQEAKSTTVTLAAFHTTHVYGNVFVRGTPSGSLIRYGGDSGITADYRKGALRFYNNTVIIQNGAYVDWTRTAIFELAPGGGGLWSRNNVYYSSVAPTPRRPIGMLGERDKVISGAASFAGDWAGSSWGPTNVIPGGATVIRAVVTGFDALARGADPGFASILTADYTIALSTQHLPAPLAPDVSSAMLPVVQYGKHQATKERVGAGIGALVR